MTLETWAYNAGVPVDQLQNGQYTESKDSGKESYSPGGSSANRVLICNWNNRPDFLDALLGYSYVDDTGAIHRVLPDEHPDIDNFFAEDATVEGKGVLGANDNEAISWTAAFVTANYKPRSYAVLEDEAVTSEMDRYTTRIPAYGAEYLTLQNGMKFVSHSRVLNAPPSKLVVWEELTYVWHQVPALPYDQFTPPNQTAINNCRGKCNSVAFDVNGRNCKAGTVLFLGVDPKMITGKLAGDTATTSSGNYHWEITMKFMYRDNGLGVGGEEAGVNYIYDIQNGIWDLVTDDGTSGGVRIYQSADLNTLWTIG